MRLEDAWIMLHESDERTPEVDKQPTHTIIVFVEDVGAHFERARAAGAEITEELNETIYGEHQYGAADLAGHAAERRLPPLSLAGLPPRRLGEAPYRPLPTWGQSNQSWPVGALRRQKRTGGAHPGRGIRQNGWPAGSANTCWPSASVRSAVAPIAVTALAACWRSSTMTSRWIC